MCTLFLRARMRSWTLLPSYLRYLPKLSMKILSSRVCQSFPTTEEALCSKASRLASLGSRHIISKRSEASCRKLSRRPASQKKGCKRTVVVSGLDKTLGQNARLNSDRFRAYLSRASGLSIPVIKSVASVPSSPNLCNEAKSLESRIILTSRSNLSPYG